MITFERGDVRFNYRVVGIAFDADRVLLHRAERDDFWALPGGRGESKRPEGAKRSETFTPGAGEGDAGAGDARRTRGGRPG